MKVTKYLGSLNFSLNLNNVYDKSDSWCFTLTIVRKMRLRNAPAIKGTMYFGFSQHRLCLQWQFQMDPFKNMNIVLSSQQLCSWTRGRPFRLLIRAGPLSIPILNSTIIKSSCYNAFKRLFSRYSRNNSFLIQICHSTISTLLSLLKSEISTDIFISIIQNKLFNQVSYWAETFLRPGK